ncbi:stage II sporulation protein P [Planococcus antarcticus DSM 14505]|uniref:Stage II sporulation protein P n=1 Tax=Planococcus antarcticus DSM 14505 TaxID=1185653 RepID=A0A1C7DHI0_9BACL|nr:stage II sporulation protein P [Planococcus antarcticus]ANU11029.1 stage II sporulation protein P [Planococcus antarcticus DSM 14505]EIM07038.1 stage II sporulation protein P [Planococcus antarcticus DSM 14505]
MSSKNKEYTEKTKNKKSKLTDLLYLALALSTSLLIVALAFIYFNIKQNASGNSVADKLESQATADSGASNFYFEFLKPENGTSASPETILSPDQVSMLHIGQPTRDEFQPSMKDLLKERDLSSENIEELVDNITSGNKIDTGHSTFGKNVIYIYHSHSRESFLPYLKKTNQPEDAYHSKANITLVGEMLGKALERRGLGTTVNSTDIVQELDSKGLNYGRSYFLSGEHVKAAQKENRNLEIFLDIHRDSLRKNSTTVELNNEDYARLLFVVGTSHKEFAKNLAFTKELHQQLETQYPGLSKGTLEKDSSQGNGVYNQNLSPNSVIVEIGGVDNTVEELHRTVEALADVLSNYYWHEEQ